MSATIQSARLDLIPLTPSVIRALLAWDLGEAGRLLGVCWPADCEAHRDFLELRLGQLEAVPGVQPWLARAMVLREEGMVVGTIGFHSPPGHESLEDLAPGAVEFGYEITATYRRRGLVSEAIEAMMRWAREEHGVKRFVVSISPENGPSLSLAAKLGFQKIGSHIDAFDGPEDIFARGCQLHGAEMAFASTPAPAAAPWLVSAPGRVNLIGEHVDYCDGFVLPVALGLRTWMSATPRGDGRIMVETEEGERAEIAPQPGAEKWANYLRGVLAGFLETGLPVHGMDVRLASTLPQGAGLASSAALTVAFASLLEAATGRDLERDEKARICQAAEAWAGVPSGCMDQLAAVHGRAGHAMLIDCRSRAVEHIPLGEAALIIINTGVKHDLADGAYAARRAETQEAARLLGVPALRDASLEILAAGRLPDVLHRRARHVISEIQRTLDCAAALQSGDLPRAGALMNASHDSLRDDFEVSCAELDAVAAHTQSLPEVFGCRMTGGGFGGCCVALVSRAAAAAAERMADEFCRSRLGPGAGVVRMP